MSPGPGRRSSFVTGAVSVAVLVDSLLYSAVVPVLPTYAERHGASHVAIGVLFASYAAALLAVTPFVGLISDRVGHRVLLVSAMVGVTGATLLFAAADSYPTLLAARSLQGAAAGAVWTSGVALVATQVDPRRLGVALGTVMASMSAGLLIGPPLSGALVTAFGFRAPFLLVAATAAMCTVVQLFVTSQDGVPAARGATRSLLRTGDFGRIMVVVAVAAAALAMLEPLVPLDLAGRLGSSAAVIGLVFGAATLAHLVAAPLVGCLADSGDAVALMTWGLVGMAVTAPFAASVGSPLGTALVLVGFAVAYSFVLIPALPAVAVLVREHGGGYASAYAMFNVAYAIGMVLGPTAASVVVESTSLSWTLAAAGSLLGATAILVRATTSRWPRSALFSAIGSHDVSADGEITASHNNPWKQRRLHHVPTRSRPACGSAEAGRRRS